MTTTFAQNIQKYQQLAGSKITSAVANAAKKTGVDFSFLMQKAQTESSFNPTAKAKSSSATGLYQFIDQTWLSMVKKYGEKYGLDEQAAKIDMQGGKAVVSDPVARKQILDLRKNPEISALMAGEFTAENKNYLECSTNCEVGNTELYLAHFMGAGGAAKFLNSRDINGSVSAAQLFPAAAKANPSIFYDRATGQAKSLNQIYDHFAKKFSDGTTSPLTQTAAAPSAGRQGSVLASATAAPSPSSPSNGVAAQTLALSADDLARLPVFDDENDADDIIWNDDPRFYGTLNTGNSTLQRLSPVTIMAMTQMQEVLGDLKGEVKESRRYNS